MNEPQLTRHMVKIGVLGDDAQRGRRGFSLPTFRQLSRRLNCNIIQMGCCSGPDRRLWAH